MNLFHTLSRLESNDDVHLPRLLILLGAFAGPDGVRSIEGLTKLAKLDFLLRYPVYLESALRSKNASTRAVQVEDHERTSVESKMVRYRYGPWDFRYRRFINILVAKGLARVDTHGRRIEISLTSTGLEIVNALSRNEAFHDLARRSKLLKQHFDQQGTTLMRFVYKTFPEIGTLRLGEGIRS